MSTPSGAGKIMSRKMDHRCVQGHWGGPQAFLNVRVKWYFSYTPTFLKISWLPFFVVLDNFTVSSVLLRNLLQETGNGIQKYIINAFKSRLDRMPSTRNTYVLLSVKLKYTLACLKDLKFSLFYVFFSVLNSFLTFISIEKRSFLNNPPHSPYLPSLPYRRYCYVICDWCV